MKLHITNTFLKQSQSTSGLLSNIGIHRDTKLTGFGVRITPATISFIVEAKNKLGRVKRKTLGRYPFLTLSEARIRALEVLREIKTGREKLPTLSMALSSYLSSMKHRPGTVYDYKSLYKNYLSEWGDVSVEEINRDMVISKYVSSSEKSIAQANNTMKLLHAVIRFSGVSDNPVAVLAQRRLKKQLKPKTSYIPLSDLKLFYKGLEKVKRPSVKLYIELLLHTGLRANEAMQITKDSVSTGVLIITATKNHSDHHVPITKWLQENLIPFLGDTPEGFTVNDSRRSLIRACQYLGYTVTRHDLRRTFASYASEAGCDYLLIKRALNHSISDITARYIQTSPEALRPVFDSVSNLIEKQLSPTSLK